MTTHADDNERLAALKRLYESLPEAERAQIDGECLRLRAKIVSHQFGPMTAFEVVMATRWYMLRLVNAEACDGQAHEGGRA